MARRLFRGMRSAFASAFGWCNSDEDELVNVERASHEAMNLFKNQFEEQFREVSGGRPSGLEASSDSFGKLCVNARR